jgi:sterol desaturase/sphingolipid hydroxylase (fatty acid hydroxylase superfamily)
MTAWFWFFWGFLIFLLALEQVVATLATARSRIGRWPANIGLGMLNGALFSLLPATTVWTSQWAESEGAGLLHWISAPIWIAVLATVAIRSLAQYAFHRLAHCIPALWSVHRVHHSDHHLDATTGLRFHPLEMLAASLFMGAVALMGGLLPLALVAYEIAEIIVGIFTHTSLDLPHGVDRRLRAMFITPALHRLHHSDDSAEADTNYGALLSLWDRIFGTYCPEPRGPPAESGFGVEDVSAEQARSFAWLIASPWLGTNRHPGLPASSVASRQAAPVRPQHS